VVYLTTSKLLAGKTIKNGLLAGISNRIKEHFPLAQ